MPDPKKIIALVDCNNFYASCERVFNPQLNNKPVVVLSNNDGCAIARSREAKDVGVAMGMPYFQMKSIIRKHDITVLSSNYTLYGDMSARVMEILRQNVPDMEIYSIDEAFIDLTGVAKNKRELKQFLRILSNKVTQGTGIPISIGAATTKALSKVANKMVKASRSTNNNIGLIISEKDRITALSSYSIEDVWGIGRRRQTTLKNLGIKTAWDFTRLPASWVRKQMTVTGLRLHLELKGTPSIEMEEDVDATKRQSIMCSRSFGSLQSELPQIERAVANLAARCAEKLRRQDSKTRALGIFLRTDRHKYNLEQHNPSITIELPQALSATNEIISIAKKLLSSIYKEGVYYKKAGVLAIDLVSADTVQLNIFINQSHNKKNDAAMLALDEINEKYAAGTIKIAAQGLKKEDWQMRSNFLSNKYTTQWDQLITVQ